MTNHLIHETSPYLLQHAANPVDWHAWNPESLRLAREQDKPILLSIGYSACHWCHVMAHDSFEDAEVAALMNKLFVNIKVDREERPDLDQIYQTAHAMLTQRSGGWPLTMFLEPDGTPFFGGTFFPKQMRHNLPAFPDVLRRVAGVYAESRAELKKQGRQLIAALNDTLLQTKTSDAALNDAPLALSVKQFGENFDRVHGGFGDAPKFPHPVELDWLLRRSQATADSQATYIVLHSLEQMAKGGIYDQLGGGFCRYSVDAYWNIPHFEKMLYDNGLLLSLYSDAWQCSGNPLFAQVVEQTAGWVMREMQAKGGRDAISRANYEVSPFPLPNPLPLAGEGADESLRGTSLMRGYYSSLDADSEHDEGKFYVWQPDEIRSLLSAEEYAVAAPHYGLERAPNFDQVAWHLHVSTPLDEVAASLRLDAEQAKELLNSARQKLFAARGLRVHPGRDEKILGSWNGLMITGMARAARVLQRRDWLDSAQGAMDFLRNTLWREGKLLATCRDGKAHLNAYLDDHAFLLQAALELLQAGFRREDLEFAAQLADALLANFEDRQNGGFFFTRHDHEALIQRPKTGQDNATPSGNGIAAIALQRLSLITGKPEYAQAAERCLKLFFPEMLQAASYHSSLCAALAENLQPPALLVLRGTPNETATWQGELQRRYLPGLMTITPPENSAGLPEPLNKPAAGQATAWLCAGAHCLPPITQFEELLSALENSGISS